MAALSGVGIRRRPSEHLAIWKGRHLCSGAPGRAAAAPAGAAGALRDDAHSDGVRLHHAVAAWRMAPESSDRHTARGWLVPFACVFGFMLFIGAWWTQPHFGANVCPSKGFMWNTDFVEEVRPTIHRKISRRSVQQGDWLPNGVTVAQFVAVADQAVDLLKQCVAERGVNYCRYAGPDPNGVMMDAQTIDGPNAIEQQDTYKYRFIKAGLDYDISMVQQDAGGSWFRIRTSRFGKPLDEGGKICDLGCWCNVNYGR